MTPVIVKASLVLLVVGALLPLLAWTERRRALFVGGGPARPEAWNEDAPRLTRPFLELWNVVVRGDRVPTGAHRRLHLAAPGLVVLPGLLVFAVIPFAGTYTVDGLEWNLAVADPDWGVLYVFMLGVLSSYGIVMAGWASNESATLLGSLRAAAQSVSYGAALGMSLVAMLMIYETLQLQSMVLAQDTQVRVFSVFVAMGMPLPDFLLGAPFVLPGWGIFLQPAAFLLCFACLLGHGRKAPFDTLVVESELGPGYVRSDLRDRSGLAYLAELVPMVVIAALLTTVFLGGWTIPWLETAAVIGGLALVLGEGPATWICMLLHFVSFVSKTLLLMGGQLFVRWTLPRLDYPRAMDLCWKAVLPLSVLNVFVTGLCLLLIGGRA